MADRPILAALAELLDAGHLASSDQMPDVVAAAAAHLGWTADVYLVDYEQDVLVPFGTGSSQRSVQPIDATAAGRAYRHVKPVSGSSQPGHMWVPLIDGVERLGVLELAMPDGTDLTSPDTTEAVRWFAHLAGHLIAGKAPYSDTYHQVKARTERTVASELVWSLLPPLTTAAHGLVISAILEPAHAVAGDVFDYAVDARRADISIIDATGHDLSSGMIGAVALAASRNARRQALGLEELTRRVDLAFADLAVDTFATGTFGTLDTETGRFEYINAGHPAPLLLRAGRVVKSLDAGRRTLLGLTPKVVTVATEMLEPGDSIIMYTDGVTEARDAGRAFYGLDRFIDTIERCAADGLTAPESLRRIGRAVLEHQLGILQDDATMIVMQWRTSQENDLYAT